MSILFDVEDFDAAHGTYALLVGALLTVVGARLVHHRLADATLLERRAVRTEAGLAGRERLVLVDDAAAALGRVARALLPRVRRYDFAQLFGTFLAHHF